MVKIENVKTVNSVGFNLEKTNELIEDLKSQGMIVGIEDLGSYLRTQGLIVKEHIGRKRNYIVVGPKLYGVDVTQKGDQVKEFMKEHIKMGRLSFLPESYEKRLTSVDNSVRVKRRGHCIGYDETFMPIEAYKEYQKEFEEKKKEYFEIRDEIVSNWEGLLHRFKEILKISLDELNSIDKEVVFESIISKLPSKEEYKDSFYMTLSAKAFPVTENLGMFDESIQEQIRNGLKQETVSTLYEIIGNTLNDAFLNVSRTLRALQKKDKVSSKTLGALRKSAKRIAQKNIFNNKKIDEIRLGILNVGESSHDTEVMCENAENVLATIYGYACELGIEDTIKFEDSPVTVDDLQMIYEMLSPQLSEPEACLL
ncbi:hypothetical protein [Paenibacillus polymyxa]|uniref:Uncharacterized protein n=1 Tax=Paenibacillus polymyxa (strain SC2) TaxID=886882 RepID=E3EKC7_PAEPS|nr:hypothetical protein [Paenibacillus polymyxa]ADO59454.1 hypothetical protein PPSC2_27790 [Paenibacillus polymyxa SC2]WPQ59706.1 hypothetical protein SKN87_29030 [Paenibacillus polymyxa]